MNNRGWGLNVMLVFTGILLLALIIVIVEIQNNFKKLEANYEENSSQTEESIKPTYTTYEDIEFALIKSAGSYVRKYYSEDFLEGDYITVPLSVLQKEKFIGPIYDIKDETTACTGYVGFIKQEGIIDYEPYIKCGKNYTTKGYIERHDTVAS